MVGIFARGACLVVMAGCVAGTEPVEEPARVWVAVSGEDIGLFEEVFGARAAAPMAQGGRSVALAEVPESMLGALASTFHESRHRCGGFVTFADRKEADRRMASPIVVKPIVDYTLDNGALAVQMRDAIDKARIVDVITELSKYTTRYYSKTSGKQAAEWLRDRWKTYVGQRTDARVELWAHDWLQPSVVLTIDGTTAPDEVVVIGGHIDSIAFSFFSLTTAPGADDDASGIGTISEVARVMLEQGIKPERTVKFIAYAAEEVGLRGSAEIAEKFYEDGIDVVGVLQLDMVAYKGSTKDIHINKATSDPAQNQFLEKLIEAYLPELEVGTVDCGYACSDHANWDEFGFPASNPFEADMDTMNPKIHSSKDTLSVFGGNADHAVKFGRLAATYVAELAGGTSI